MKLIILFLTASFLVYCSEQGKKVVLKRSRGYRELAILNAMAAKNVLQPSDLIMDSLKKPVSLKKKSDAIPSGQLSDGELLFKMEQ